MSSPCQYKCHMGTADKKNDKRREMVRTSNVFSHMVLFMALFSFMLFAPRAVQCAEKWDNNRKQAESGKVESGGTWYAPFEKEIKGKFRTVVLGNAEITGNKGGTAKASYNKGIFGAGSIAAGITGGFASVGKYQDTNNGSEDYNCYALTSADASYNSITMQSGSIISSDCEVEVNNSFFLASDGTPNGYGYICGGFAQLKNVQNDFSCATASNNSIFIKNGSSEKGMFPPINPEYYHGSPYDYFILGGSAELYSKGTAVADHNKVVVNVAANNYKEACIVGGYAFARKGYASTSNNYVEVEKAGECTWIFGGYAGISEHATAVSGNQINIKDGIIKKDVAGSRIAGMQGDGSPEYNKSVVMASGNTVCISGGRYEGDIYGVDATIWPDIAIIEKNKVIISCGSSMPKFSDKTSIRGYSIYKTGSVSKFSDNSLEFRAVKGLTAGNIENFNKIIFELPDMKTDETVLSLTGYPYYDSYHKTYIDITNITNVTVDVQKIGKLTNIDGGEFRVGDKVYLLKNDIGIKTQGCILKTVPSSQGYTLELKADYTSVYLTRIK